MKKISKFIPMDGTGEETAGGIGGTTNGYTTNGYTTTTGGIETTDEGNTTFKVCGSSSNLPAKQSGFFTKLKSVLFYEIKVELTPYQQKIEDEINEFLHQEVTWQGFKNFLFQDISFSKKNKTKVK